MKQHFEWDDTKAENNIRKHKIPFEKAILVFKDPYYQMRPDRIAEGEERWHAIGMADNFLLLVVYTSHEVDDTEIVRIISARKPEPRERREYEQNY